ncbi:tail fiber domain-containing protein [Hyphomicrobium sp. CS1BSMeth3]|uniref:tail fiber domain-containing protein n=1 Tax=Hyphomicrobium sp. CS1BSMeth3 TaxID=1892844 RepID=UPI0009306108|nr:tail fiber domain-containing protein [Hyphomicrobium sp. CS1BSMeth3]
MTFAVAALLPIGASAADWANFATVSMTNPTTPKLANRAICYTDGRDIICDNDTTYITTGGLINAGALQTSSYVSAGSIHTSGTVMVSNTVYATQFVGDGSLLTGLGGIPDRIVSGTTSVITYQNNSISLTTNSIERMNVTNGGIAVYGSASFYPAGAGIRSLHMQADSSFDGVSNVIRFRQGTTTANAVLFSFFDNASPPLVLRNYSGVGYVGIGMMSPTARLHVSGTISATDAIQVGTSSLACGSGILGAIRYDTGSIEYCNGAAWTGLSSNTTGGGATDRIVSGTGDHTRIVAVSNTGFISITQNSTDTGWFDPARGLVTLGVSATGPISGTSGYFAGYVGISTTTPREVLSIGNGQHLHLGGSLAHYFNAYWDGTQNVFAGYRGGAKYSAQLEFNPNAGIFYVKTTPDTGAAGAQATLSQRITIPSSGNVGISKTVPLAKLDVDGTISASNAIQVGTSSLDCSAGIPGAIRYDNGSIQYCDGVAWAGLSSSTTGAGVSDRIVSGSAVAYISPTGTVFMHGRLEIVTGTSVVAIGPNAAANNTNSFVVGIGANAARNNSGLNVVAIGDWTGWDNTGDNVLAIGANAAASNTGSFVTAIGSDAGYYNSGPYGLTAIGPWAGYGNTANYVTAVGNTAGWDNRGHGATMLGDAAGQSNTGDDAVLLGSVAGYANTGHRVTAVGTWSAAGASASPHNSVFVGFESGKTVADAERNTFLGTQSGDNVTSGDDNILIGYQARTPQPDTNTFLNIGNAISGTATAAGNLSFIGGIKANGIVTATYFEGDGSRLTGIGGGDRIVSGSLAVIANSQTSVVSLSTAGTVWGYLGSAMSYLPRINADRVSSTLVSSTYVQLSSATQVLACTGERAGTLRYVSGSIQFCHNSAWKGLGGAGEYLQANRSSAQNDITAGSAVLFGSSWGNTSLVSLNTGNGRFTLLAGHTYRLMGNFRLATGSPSSAVSAQWYNVTASSGFGLSMAVQSGNLADNASDLEMAVGYITPAADTVVELRITWATTGADLSTANASIDVMMTGASDGGGGASSLADLTDVSVAGASTGSILAYNGSSWVVSSTSGDGALGDRIVSGTSNVVVNQNGAISFTMGGLTRMALGASGKLQIGAISNTTWDPDDEVEINSGHNTLSSTLAFTSGDFGGYRMRVGYSHSYSNHIMPNAGAQIIVDADGQLHLAPRVNASLANGIIFYTSSNSAPIERLRLMPNGNVAISKTNALAKLDVAGTISASDAIQVGSSSLGCSSGIPGAIRYNSGSLELCNGSSWGALGGGAGDRITSGTLAVIANSNTSVVSLSTAGTTWGYLANAMSYLPRLNAERVSSTLISSTYVQLSSATAVLACSSDIAGTVRYSSSSIQFCNGGAWTTLGVNSIELMRAAGAGQTDVVTGTPIAFSNVGDSRGSSISLNTGTGRFTLVGGRTYRLMGKTRLHSSSPAGGTNYQWYNVTASAFVGAYGSIQTSHSSGGWSDSEWAFAYVTPASTIEVELRISSPTAGTDLNDSHAFIEALIVGDEGGGAATALADLTDVSVAGATTGSILSYNGSSWVVSSTGTGGGNTDRITSGTAVAYISPTGTVFMRGRLDIVTGTDVVAVGERAAANNTGEIVTAVGRFAGEANAEDYVVAVGEEAARNNTGYVVVALGTNAARDNAGDWNVAVGAQAAANNVGTGVTAVGGYAGHGNTADFVTIVGNVAGEENTGHAATIFGDSAGQGNTGDDAVLLGSVAGHANTGHRVTAVGNWSAAGASASPHNSVFFGYESGRNITDAERNTFLGTQSGDNVTSGDDNILIGYQARTPAAGTNNFLNIGNAISGTLTSGGSLTFIGGVKANGIVTATYFEGDGSRLTNLPGGGGGTSDRIVSNTAVAYIRPTGNMVMRGYLDIVTNSGVVAIGQQAATTNVTITNVTAVGYQAAQNVTDNDLTAVGYLAGRNMRGVVNTAVGARAGENANGHYSTYLGYEAGRYSTGGQMVIIGVGAGVLNSGSTGVLIGQNAGGSNSPNEVVMVGDGAGRFNGGWNSVGLGNNALGSNSGIQALAVGNNAAQYNTGGNSVFFGADAGKNNTGGFSTLIGHGAGQTNTQNNLLAIGYNAGVNNRASDAILIGYNAGSSNGGAHAIIIGNQSGRNSPTHSVIIGNNIGTFTMTDAERNLFAGHEAGSSITGGDDNVLLGFEAGSNVTTGNNNIAIGSRVQLPSGTSSGQLTIGNAIYGRNVSGTYTGVAQHARIGIKTPNPQTELEVDGTVSATNLRVAHIVTATYFEGDGSRLTGISGGGGSGDRITSGTTSVIAGQNTSITFTTAGTERVTIGSNGRVGIGTSTPSTTFVVQTAAPTWQEGALVMLVENSAGAPMLTLTNSSGLNSNNIGMTLTGSIEAYQDAALSSGLYVRRSSASGYALRMKDASGNAISEGVGYGTMYNGSKGFGVILGNTHLLAGGADVDIHNDSGGHINVGGAYSINLGMGGVANDISLTANNFRFYNQARQQLIHASIDKVGISTTNPLAKLDVAGTISASGAIQVGTSSLACGSGIPGAIRYNSGSLEYCNGASWIALGEGGGGGATDSIVSGTSNRTRVVAISSTGYISVTQNNTNTAWFDPARGLSAIGVSTTGTISGTNGYFTNRVGIGTAAPWEALQVNGNILVGSGDYIGVGNGVYGAISNRRVSIDDGTYVAAECGDLGFAQGWCFESGNGYRFNVGGQHVTSFKPGGVGILTNFPSATLHVVGTVSASGAIQVGTSSLVCGSGIPGAIRYNSGSLEYCNGTSWTALGGGGGGGATDSIVSGTSNRTRVVAISSTGYISVTQNNTNTAWFDPTRGLVAVGVSTTGVISGSRVYGRDGLSTTGMTIDTSGGWTAFANGGNGILFYHSWYMPLNMSQDKVGVNTWTGGGPANWANLQVSGSMIVSSTGMGANPALWAGANGRVSVGIANPSYNFQVSGSIAYSGPLVDLSDRRYKIDIKPLASSLERLRALEPVTFRKKNNPAQLELGFIAQDVEKLFPDLVLTADDTSATKSLNYVGLIAPMVKGMQELKAENDKLRGELAMERAARMKLEAANDNFETRMRVLEAANRR